jgi:signal transduction histidine kinase
MMYPNCQASSADSAHWQSNDLLPLAGDTPPLRPLWRNPLPAAFLIAGLILAFQLGMTLLQPSWRVSATDWLRAVLAWLGLLVLSFTSLRLTHMRRPESLAWWMISAGFLMYAIAQTLWAVEEQVIFPDNVPSPWWSDLFYLLQYPCYFLALTMLPRVLPGEQPVVTRMKMILDCLLVMAAATALSWYFLLEPIYIKSSQSLFGKITSLAYPIGDLGMFFGLVLVLVYRRPIERSVLALLMGAVAYLTLADSWSASMALHASYLGGNPPDVFWMTCYLLFPLAGLVQFHLAQRETTAQPGQPQVSPPQALAGGVFMGSLRFLFPFVVALLAGGIIIVQATVQSDVPNSPLISLAVAFGLVILVIARQELTFLECEHWRHEREVARANELAALREAQQQMDTFLGMASHELKTPLSSIKLGLQVQARRLRRLAQRDGKMMIDLEPILEGLTRAGYQEQRLELLVNDLLDVTRIQAGKLELRPEWTDLVDITRAAVEEQQQARPNRAILLRLPADLHIPVYADANRIEQVVTNYLTNALKYTPEDRPIAVGIEKREQQACVWVRDEGPGLPPEEHPLIWERFHRARGIEVQSGTGIGLGLGLHICRTIIERHQGQVGVESSPGKGSTFWFTLPLDTSSEDAHLAV